MTRVLALVSYKVFPPQMGGQKGIVLFYKHLKSLLPVTLAVSRNNATTSHDWDVMPVLFDNRKMFLNPFVYGRLKKVIVEKRIDVIVAEHSYTGWLAWLFKKTLRLPFLIHSHNIEALRFQQMGRRWWKIYKVYEKWIHQKADHNFFISRDDAQFAIENFRLNPDKCSVINYGVEAPTTPTVTRKEWLHSIGLKGNESVFYFNGTLDYKPNSDAVITLMEQIAPLLQQQNISFKIIISGNRASQTLLKQIQSAPHILFLDHVENVETVYAYADVFLNPVLNTSGVKTKVIEALAASCPVVSTESGAWGINKEVCGDQLRLAPDGNWPLFVQQALLAAQRPVTGTPKAFYDSYLWNNIAQQAAEKIREVAHKHAH